MAESSAATALAIQQIEYLRRRYAHATDRIGENTEASIAEGRAIYHEIFTPDARIRATSDGEVQLESFGPDAWLDVVLDALGPYVATQHLIGSQLVTLDRLQQGENGEPVAGEAQMQSYLQAWHAREDSVWLYFGTYHDEVRYVPGIGWQIHDMTLAQTSGEDRPLGAPRSPGAD